MKADPLRTSACGDAASKRLSLARCLLDAAAWRDCVAEFAAGNPYRGDKAASYREVVESGAALDTGRAVCAGTFSPTPPVQAEINKADGRKKIVYQFPPREELLFKVLNRALQPVVAPATSARCHSFLPERGVRSAFKALLADRDIDTKACLRLDIRDYFNSIDAADLIAGLPGPVSGDDALHTLLSRTLLSPWVMRDGVRVVAPRKGVMAGTPLAPLLANLYLKGLDDLFDGVTYARYSDDIIVFGSPAEVTGHNDTVRGFLNARGLLVNEAKSAVTAAGEPWEYLGLRYHRGAVDLSSNTRRKFRAKARRLARRLDRWRRDGHRCADDALGRFVRRTNRRLYGVPRQRDEFCWATWFFPVLTTAASLGELDAVAQAQARFAASGRRTARARRQVPYEKLRDAGYVPLVAAYWAYRRGPESYSRLIGTRVPAG